MSTAIELFDWLNSRVDVTLLPPEISHFVIESFLPGKYDEASQAQIDTVVEREHLKAVSPYEVLHIWLVYEGLLGYTDRFCRLFNALQEAAASRDK